MKPFKQGEINQTQYQPTQGEVMSFFSTPIFRGELNLNHQSIQSQIGLLIEKSKERHGDDDLKNYTTYFDEDLRIEMEGQDWYNDFANQIKDTYITLAKDLFGLEVDYLTRHDIHLFAWANLYRKPHQHEVHNHVNSFMSGTYYVKSTPDQPIKFWSPNLMSQFSHMSVDQPIEDKYEGATVVGNNATESEVHFFPNNGQFLLWPSYLQHAVPVIAHDVPEDYCRISISFNLKHRLKLDSNETGDNMSYGFLNE